MSCRLFTEREARCVELKWFATRRLWGKNKSMPRLLWVLSPCLQPQTTWARLDVVDVLRLFSSPRAPHTQTPSARASWPWCQPGFGGTPAAGDVWPRSLSFMPASHFSRSGGPLVSAWVGVWLCHLNWKTQTCRFADLSDFLWFWRPRSLTHTINRLLSYFIYIALFQTGQISYPLSTVSKNNKYEPQR